MPAKRDSLIIWIFVIVWILLFFPLWFRMIYVKIDEWKDSFGRSAVDQRARLHTQLNIMQSSIQWILRQSEADTYSIVVPPHETFPQVGSFALWRSLQLSMAPKISLSRSWRLQNNPQNLVVFYPGPGVKWAPLPISCQAGGCSCLSWSVATVKYWKVGH